MSIPNSLKLRNLEAVNLADAVTSRGLVFEVRGNESLISTLYSMFVAPESEEKVGTESIMNGIEVAYTSATDTIATLSDKIISDEAFTLARFATHMREKIIPLVDQIVATIEAVRYGMGSENETNVNWWYPLPKDYEDLDGILKNDNVPKERPSILPVPLYSEKALTHWRLSKFLPEHMRDQLLTDEEVVAVHKAFFCDTPTPINAFPTGEFILDGIRVYLALVHFCVYYRQNTQSLNNTQLDLEEYNARIDAMIAFAEYEIDRAKQMIEATRANDVVVVHGKTDEKGTAIYLDGIFRDRVLDLFGSIEPVLGSNITDCRYTGQNPTLQGIVQNKEAALLSQERQEELRLHRLEKSTKIATAVAIHKLLNGIETEGNIFHEREREIFKLASGIENVREKVDELLLMDLDTVVLAERIVCDVLRPTPFARHYLEQFRLLCQPSSKGIQEVALEALVRTYLHAVSQSCALVRVEDGH